jgi:small-conductance mechanosensitive channel
VLDDPPPDVLPWEFSQNNINIRVRWWMKSQRTFEVRTRSGVVIAIKRACEEAGINIPADTTISFAETPLIVDSHPKGKDSKPRKKPAKPTAKSRPADVAPVAPADERLDPEAEEPKLGELNEGVEELPR